ncbi:MAG: hypothetical protein ISS90_01175 [Candidatus Omnitrophica bacterium]|nr:hypothetical protein [Candidatus Omnitrophota bacterium]
MLRFIELSRARFLLEDFDLALETEKTFIEPDFADIFDKKAIVLRCVLDRAFFSNVREMLPGEKEISRFLGEGPFPLLDNLINVVFDTMDVTLVIYGKTVEFPSFVAESPDIKIFASGSVTDGGDSSVRMKIFLSSRFTEGLPEAVRELLKEEAGGWHSYSISFEGGKNRPSFKLESDRFNIEFKRIEVR